MAQFAGDLEDFVARAKEKFPNDLEMQARYISYAMDKCKEAFPEFNNPVQALWNGYNVVFCVIPNKDFSNLLFYWEIYSGVALFAVGVEKSSRSDYRSGNTLLFCSNIAIKKPILPDLKDI